MAITTWNIDTAHTDVLFSAKHMMVTTVRGKFADVRARSPWTRGAHPSGSFTVAVASLNTGVERDSTSARPTFDAEHPPPPSPPRSRPGAASHLRRPHHPQRRDPPSRSSTSLHRQGAPAGFHAQADQPRDFGLNWNVALEPAAGSSARTSSWSWPSAAGRAGRAFRCRAASQRRRAVVPRSGRDPSASRGPAPRDPSRRPAVVPHRGTASIRGGRP
jgi:hypothetical protein